MDNFASAEIFKLANTVFREMSSSLEISYRQHNVPEKAVWDITRAVEDAHLKVIKGLEDIFIIESVPGLREDLQNIRLDPAIEEFIKIWDRPSKKEPARRGRERSRA